MINKFSFSSILRVLSYSLNLIVFNFLIRFMRSYFLLPPNINLGISNDQIKGSITFLNYPNNIQQKNYKKITNSNIYLGIFVLSKQEWILIDVKCCKYSEFLVIERKNLSVSDTEIIVAITSNSLIFPKKCELLPKPYSLRIDNSNISERVSFNMAYKSSFTSYQSEYPFEISDLSNPSFFSFDALKTSNKNKKIKNYLILMNLYRNAKKQKERVIQFFNPIDSNNRFTFQVRENSLSIMDLSSLDEKILSEDLVFLSCKNCTFIPLTLSLDENNNQLKLEHTHPPSEFFSGDDRFKLTKTLRENWIK